ncbi:MAG: DUF3806 domain-containing protein [Hyphomicrobiales bacterium]|nr:DUF3806 domain-containing protein [Hyphomicrobiales bacterium]
MEISDLDPRASTALQQAMELFLYMADLEGYSERTITQEALPVLQRLYDAAIVMDADTSSLEAPLGIALGEIFRANGDFEWVRVADEYGAETSLAVPGTTLTIHPISMIAKRIDAREQLDLAELVDDVCTRVKQILAEGNYTER